MGKGGGHCNSSSKDFLPSETSYGSIVFSCWFSDEHGVVAESDLLLLETSVKYVGSSTLLGQPNMVQN